MAEYTLNYTGNKINALLEQISEITGCATYTNLFDKTADGYRYGYRFNSSFAETADTNSIITNYIPVTAGQILHIKGIATSVNGGTTYCRATGYDANKNAIDSDGGIQVPTQAPAAFVVSDYDNSVVVWPAMTGDNGQVNYAGIGMHYIRISGYLAGSVDDVVITVEEKIVGGENGYLEEVKSSVAEVKELVANFYSGYNIPDYWKDTLDEAVEKIKVLHDDGGMDCVSFPVLTDMHYPNNLGKNSPALARYIMDRTNAKYALCLGDVFTRGVQWDKDGAEKHYADIEEMLKPLRNNLLQTQGNHDGTYGYEDFDGDGTYSAYLYNYTPQEMYERIYRKVGNAIDVHFDSQGSNAYYVDDISNRIRFIMLNTHCTLWELDENGHAKYNNMHTFRYTQKQYDFLINDALLVPDDSWGIIVASHVPLNQSGEMPEGYVMEGVLNAYKNKTSYTGEYEGTGKIGEGIISTPNFTDLCDETSSDFISGYRINNSNAQESGNELYCITNYIPCKFDKTTPDILRVKGFDSNAMGDIRVQLYNSNKAVLGNGGWHGYGAYPSDFTINDGVLSWNIGSMANYMSSSTYGTTAYVRVTCLRNNTDLVVTVNEEITYTETEGSNTETAYDTVKVDVDFSNANGELIAYFAGHIHKDTSSNIGFPIITTRCDAQEENDSVLKAERVVGTTTEQSFDVFTVNRKEKKIYATKIGAGIDREVSY